MMKCLKKIFDFYIFSNIHVALATFCLAKISLVYVGNYSNRFPLFVLFATLLSYNFIRLYRRAEIKSWLYDWIASNKLLLYIVSVISLFAIVGLGGQLKALTLLLLIPFGFLTFFYTIPLFKGKSFRAMSGIKLFLISFSWAGVTVLLPLLDNDLLINKDAWITFIQRFFFVATIAIPFDIRDINFDNEKLNTLPQAYGIDKVKRIGMFFLMLFLGLNFLKTNATDYLQVEFIIALVSLFFLVRSTINQNRYYSAFFVEAIPILWFILIYLK